MTLSWSSSFDGNGKRDERDEDEDAAALRICWNGDEERRDDGSGAASVAFPGEDVMIEQGSRITTSLQSDDSQRETTKFFKAPGRLVVGPATSNTELRKQKLHARQFIIIA
jgi:hypothetical protein